MAAEQITKLDAAERQLRAAIRLLFEERDSLAVYALAAASRDVLRGLSHAAGLQGSVFKDADYIRPDKRKEAIEILNRPQNFLKHADKDPAGVLTFDAASAAVYVLVDCAEMHRRLTGRPLRDCHLFMIWFSLNNPDVLEPGPYADGILSAAAMHKEATTDKSLLNSSFLWMLLHGPDRLDLESESPVPKS